MKWSFIEKLIYRGFIEKHFVSKCKALTEAQALQSYILVISVSRTHDSNQIQLKAKLSQNGNPCC